MSTKITLTYSGARIEHERAMPALEVAAAIRGMAELVTRTGKLLHGTNTRIVTSVEPHFRRGSFEIPFLFDPTGIDLETMRTILFVLFGNKYRGLVSLFSRRPPDRLTDDTAEEDSPIATLQGDKRVQDSADRIARPVRKGDVAEELEIRDRSSRPVFERTRIDRKHFHFPTEGPADIYVSEERLRIIRPSFRPRTVWHFLNMGGQRISAYMADRGFMQEVLDRQIMFAEGDELIVDMEIEAKVIRGRPLFRRRIVRVHKHLSAMGV